MLKSACHLECNHLKQHWFLLCFISWALFRRRYCTHHVIFLLFDHACLKQYLPPLWFLLLCQCQSFPILFGWGWLIRWISQSGLKRISCPMMRSSRATGRVSWGANRWRLAVVLGSGFSPGEELGPLEKLQLLCRERKRSGRVLGGFDFSQPWVEPQRSLDKQKRCRWGTSGSHPGKDAEWVCLLPFWDCAPVGQSAKVQLLGRRILLTQLVSIQLFSMGKYL